MATIERCLLQVEPTLEAIAFERIGATPVGTLTHAVGARLSCRHARSRCKESICSLHAVVGKYFLMRIGQALSIMWRNALALAADLFFLGRTEELR